MLVLRTWNLFHGRTCPPSRRTYLDRMVRLVTEDGPDIVAFQEVPVWALRRLEAWSGMRAFAAVTKRALLRPVARRLQRLDPRRVRSPLTGQANALLLGARLEVAAPPRSVILNAGSRRERRVCQLLEARAGDRTILVANFHATARDERAALGEVERVAELVAGTGPCVVLGDFNVPGVGLPGFSGPGPGIDQIIVRGLELVEGPAPWPDARRTVEGLLLSDHAPIEAVIA